MKRLKMLLPSDSCIDLIKQFEGFSSKAYPDSTGVYTIGFGTICYPNGKKVRLSDPECTKEQATEWLQNDLKRFVVALNDMLKVDLPQNKFDALCSLIYNIGPTNLKSSTLMKKLNKEDFAGASLEFLKWNKAGNVIIPGLVNRRFAEKKVFDGT